MNASTKSIPSPVRPDTRRETVSAILRMAAASARAHPPAGVRALKPGTLATLHLALAVYQQPQRAVAIGPAALPDAEFDLLLQCAGGDSAVLPEVAAVLRIPPQTLQAALDFYLEQALFARGADAWRTLGLQPGADPQQIRTHLHLAQRWIERARAHNPLGALHQTQLQQAQQTLRREARLTTTPTPPPAVARRSLLQRLLPGVRGRRVLGLLVTGVLLAAAMLWASRLWRMPPMQDSGTAAAGTTPTHVPMRYL